MSILENVFEELKRLKLHKIQQYDAQGKSFFADHYFLASADNMTQLEAVRSRLTEMFKKERVFLKNPLEEWQGGWCLLDFGDVIVHVLLEEMRSFYNLEDLFISGEYKLLKTAQEDGTEVN